MKENKTIVVILTVAAFFIGAGIGYQYRGSMPIPTFRDGPTSPSSLTMDIDTLPSNPKMIEVKKGEPAHLATIDVTVLGFERSSTITEFMSTVEEAKPGTVFLTVRLKVKNTTKQPITYSSYTDIVVDSSGRQFSPIRDLVFVRDLLVNTEINPSVDVEGVVIFEIPKDAQGLYMQFVKGGTGDIYNLNLD